MGKGRGTCCALASLYPLHRPPSLLSRDLVRNFGRCWSRLGWLTLCLRSKCNLQFYWPGLLKRLQRWPVIRVWGRLWDWVWCEWRMRAEMLWGISWPSSDTFFDCLIHLPRWTLDQPNIKMQHRTVRKQAPPSSTPIYCTWEALATDIHLFFCWTQKHWYFPSREGCANSYPIHLLPCEWSLLFWLYGGAWLGLRLCNLRRW